MERVLLPCTLARASKAAAGGRKHSPGRRYLHVSQQLFLPKYFSSATYRGVLPASPRLPESTFTRLQEGRLP